ncbi:terpenoid synthase [Imleria badia]|nr:terpenoid synthase [Imleria badia]
MSLIQDIRSTIAPFFVRFNIPYEVVPFDDVLYQECVDEAIRRGYLMDGTPSVRTYLPGGVAYTTAACAHLPHRPTQIWISLYTACIAYVDDAMEDFPLERTKIYRFNERFGRGQAHINGILDALADLLHQVPYLGFQPVSSNLIVTSTLDFVTANILEHETKTMQISSLAQQYATYHRTMAAAPEAFLFAAFPCGIPVKDYIQAMPEMMLFFNNTNDVLSFYKEELAGETTNRISILAACNKSSKLDALDALVKTTSDGFESAVEILSACPEARETFKKFAAGLIRFHISVGRYRLAELELQ